MKSFLWALFLLSLSTSLAFGELSQASMGVYAVKSDTYEVLIDKDSDLSLIPASCLKIVTTGAALHLLGPDKRFETHLEYDGTIDQDHSLKGNLYIRGGGDPCLGSSRVEGNPSWQRQIDIWVEAVQKQGVKRIEGKVIADASKWEHSLAAPSWSWEDLGNYYGAGACALSFNENSYVLYFKPGKNVGDKAEIVRTDPPILGIHLLNEVTTGPEGSGDGACIYGCEYFPYQCVRGTVPAGVEQFSIRGSIPDPAQFCADMLVHGLHEKGIPVDQRDLARGERLVIHVTLSPTVKEIVYWANQKSINLYAEHLLKKMGEEVFHEGSTDAGVGAVTNFWKMQGIDLNGFHMVDGSGLSRKNVVTAKQLVGMLQKMKKSKYSEPFFASLPQKDGSVHAKTGGMTLIKGLTGYAGDTTFAVIINQCPSSQKMNEEIAVIVTSLQARNTEN